MLAHMSHLGGAWRGVASKRATPPQFSSVTDFCSLSAPQSEIRRLFWLALCPARLMSLVASPRKWGEGHADRETAPDTQHTAARCRSLVAPLLMQSPFHAPSRFPRLSWLLFDPRRRSSVRVAAPSSRAVGRRARRTRASSTTTTTTTRAAAAAARRAARRRPTRATMAATDHRSARRPRSRSSAGRAWGGSRGCRSRCGAARASARARSGGSRPLEQLDRYSLKRGLSAAGAVDRYL